VHAIHWTILVFEEALSIIQNYWHVVRPCCLRCSHCNYCFVVRPRCFEFCIACSSSHCSAWTAPMLFSYSDLQNVFAHYVLVIFECFGLFLYDLLWKFSRILEGQVFSVAHLLVTFSKSINFTRWHSLLVQRIIITCSFPHVLFPMVLCP
jgi:hypothetical protein